MKKKQVVGLIEKITFIGPEKSITLKAKVDTGANLCSVDETIAKRLMLGPPFRNKTVKSAHGIKKRPVIKARIIFKDRRFKNVRFTLADRRHMSYSALIGVNLLKGKFVVDPSRRL